MSCQKSRPVNGWGSFPLVRYLTLIVQAMQARSASISAYVKVKMGSTQRISTNATRNSKIRDFQFLLLSLNYTYNAVIHNENQIWRTSGSVTPLLLMPGCICVTPARR